MNKIFNQPVVIEEARISWEEYITMGMEAREKKDNAQWELGDLACRVKKNYGEDAVGKYAIEIGVVKTTLQEYKTVSNFFEKSVRTDFSRLSYSHFRLAEINNTKEEAIDWLKKADDNDWTYEQLAIEIKKSKPVKKEDWIRYYDVWNFADKLQGFGENRPAQCPPQVILNFIYYFTKENDLIVDPMAGGGATTDCANYLNRKSLCYDIKPFDEKQVKFNDVIKGYPEEALGCDAIFIDPPYGSQKGEVFKEGSVSSLSTSDYVEKFMKKLFIDSYNTLKEGGMIGFLIQNQNQINLEGKYYWDFSFDAYRLMQEAGFTPYRRICVPLVGPVQYQEHDMKRCKDNKELLGVVRDLVVMIK